MGNPNLRPSDRAAVVGVIDPDAYAAATYVTGWIDASLFEDFMAIVMVGDLGSSATVNAKLTAAEDGSGTNPHDITGKAITALTDAGTDSNKQAIINVRADEISADGAYTHFKLSVTVGTATSDMGALVLGLNPHFGGASDNDATTVDEIVS